MSELKIELIAIGDEILLGHTLDSNSNWIAAQLAENGFRLRSVTVIGDNVTDLKDQLKSAWKRADVVMVTGGLGPTSDDITRPVIADFFNDKLVYMPELKELIRRRAARRGALPPPGTEVLAQFPSLATPMPNKHGSAAGIHYEIEGKELFAMPGVPLEMKGMFTDYVLRCLEKKRSTIHKFVLLRTCGKGETLLSKLIGDEKMILPVKLAYLPNIDHGVTLRLSHTGEDVSQVLKTVDNAKNHLLGKIGKYVYSQDTSTLEEVILGSLIRRGMKLALAESCTGGMLAARFVSIPGSSRAFERGFVTYTDEAKRELLGVPENTLKKHGAVSAESATAMAEGALKNAKVDVAVSVTGIAGPSGGSVDKPVGLVFIAVADKKGTISRRFRFAGDRNSNRRRSTLAALVMLRKRLAGNE